MRNRRLGVLLLLCGLALPAQAYRREYRVTSHGERKQGSEVCFYRGDSGKNPFDLFFSYDRVECLPADRVLDLPPGLFHVFARHRDGYISEHPDYFVYTGPPKPEGGYEALEIPLRSAAVLDLRDAIAGAPRSASIGVWLAPAPNAGAAFFPAVSGETTMLVPAERLLVPLLVAGHQPIAVGRPLRLSADTRESLPRFARGTSVVAWIALDPAARAQERDVSPPPDLLLVAGHKRLKPIFPLTQTPSSANALLFFADAPAGKARLEATGIFWQTASADVDVVPDTANAQRQAVVVRPGGAVLASWASTKPTAAESSCGKAPGALRPALEVRLERCATAETCTPVAKRAAAYESAGSVTFGGLAAGDYRVTLAPPGGKPLRASASVAVARQTSSAFTIETFDFFGKVTLNGHPLHARLFFATGDAESDDEGRYTAALAGDPRTALIRLQTCNEERVLTFIPHERMNPNAAYDIAVRLLTRRVHVTDRNGMPVADAGVSFAPVKDPAGRAAFYFTLPKPTDAGGTVTFEDMPAGETVDICAQKRGYRNACVPMPQGNDDVTVLLTPLAQTGKVLNHEGRGFIAAVDPRGRMTEQVVVAEDGTFGFAAVHAAPEYLVYTAPRRPLAVLPIEPSANELTIALPNAPVRSFRAIVPAVKDNTWLGLWIGTAYVPLQMLAFHEDARGLDLQPHAGQPLEIRDVLESAPLSVAVAEAPPSREFVDPFTLPQFAGVARHRVTGASITLQP